LCASLRKVNHSGDPPDGVSCGSPMSSEVQLVLHVPMRCGLQLLPENKFISSHWGRVVVVSCGKPATSSSHHASRAVGQLHFFEDVISWVGANISTQMSSPLSAQPLKVTSSSGSSKGDPGSRTPVPSRGSSPGPSKPLANPADISSPHELTAFVRLHTNTLSHPFFPPAV